GFLLRALSVLGGELLPPIAKDLAGGVVAAGAHDAAAGVGGGAAEVEAAHGGAVVGVAGDGTEEEELRRRHRSLEDVAAGEAEAALDVERGEDLAVEDGAAEVWGVLIHEGETAVGKGLLRVVPAAVPEARGRVLDEEGHDVAAGRGDGGVDH